MITNSGALSVLSLDTTRLLPEAASARTTPSSPSVPGFEQDSVSLAFSALKRPAPSRHRRGEEIVELVVTAVTLAAEVLTLALSRATERGRGSPSKPTPLLGVEQEPRTGTQPMTPWSRAVIPFAPAAPSKRLEAIQSDGGDITIRTYDGYIVRAQGRREGWSITAPDGKTTQITDNAQVRESDGGAWSFTGRSSFLFGPHKLTFEVSSLRTSAPALNKATIYSGGERVTIGDLNKERPSIQAVSGDGRSHDDTVHDGTIYLRGETKFGESWSALINGVRRVMGGR